MGQRFKPGWPLAAVLLAVCALAACGRIGVGSIATVESKDAGRVGDASDPNACTVACENSHGVAECAADSCQLTCSTGYDDCDTQASNGCETSTADTVERCGSCGQACTNEHGAARCIEGLCEPQCAAGFADCDGDAANGCESTLSSTEHCGACNVVCENAHGASGCSAGTCAPGCDAGFSDCDGLPANGCETNTASDPRHCGSCTNVCNLSAQICVAGSCEDSPCGPGRGECDGDPVESCETTVETSVEHCGFCSNVCTTPHGSPACVASTCKVAGCEESFGDCDELVVNGCEAPLATTTEHCGACGRSCTNLHGATSCSGSECVPSCASGYGDCDQSQQNGCETALDSVSHCGMCDRTCPANGGTPVCSAGVCSTQCDLNGTFALKLTIPTTWPSSPTITSGSGTFIYWALVQWTHASTALYGTVTICGHTVPDFKPAIVNETYGVIYPTAPYDGSPLFGRATSGTLGGLGPGSSFALARSALVMGVDLADPVNDAWPNRATTQTLSSDSDADGELGLTATYKSGGTYQLVRANTLGTKRAQLGYIASRVVFSLNGTLTSCTESTGSAAVQDIDSHTLGCRISASEECDSTETNNLDSNTPNFQPGPATYSLVKIAEANCPLVRDALP